MVTLFRSNREIKLDGVKCVLRVTTDGEVLYVALSPEAGVVTADTQRLSVDVTYNGEVISLVDEPPYACVEFAYADAREITLSGDGIVVDGSRRSKFTFSWDESAGSELIDVSYSIDRIKELYSSKLTLTANVRDGLCVRVIEVSCTYTDRNGNTKSRKCTMTSAGNGTYTYENPMNDIFVSPGARMQYRFEVACYADEETADADYGERFLGICDILTPNFIISPSHGQSAPFELMYPSPIAGAKIRVHWQALADANMFSLERSCGGGEFVRVYEGAHLFFVDTVPMDAVTVAYRVKASSSSWWYGESELIGHTNLYIGTSSGARAVSGLYVGRGGEVREMIPIMSVGGIE